MADSYFAAWLLQRDECARLSIQVKAISDELEATKLLLQITVEAALIVVARNQRLEQFLTLGSF